ncbi:BgiBFREP4 [Biomphalaria glabrata]|nr:BgiBFREP4 [Biomphalaria glabrata]
MKMKNLLLCLFLVSATLGSRLSFNANVEKINEVIQPLMLTCSFEVSRNDSWQNTKVQLMYIMHETKGFVATITKDQNITGNADMTFSEGQGTLNNEIDNTSFLQVTWKNASNELSGKYICVVHATNAEGKVEFLSASLKVQVQKLEIADLAQYVVDLTARVKESDDKIQNYTRNVTSIKEELNALKENHLAALRSLDIIKKVNKNLQLSCECLAKPTSCRDVISTEDRVVVTLASGLEVMCDTTTDGGGWTIFQRRFNGSIDFYRGWKEYRDGFGDYNIGEFYLGNENIFNLTSSRKYELRFDLEYENKKYFAHYSDFKLLDENNNYKLIIGSYSGTAGNNMRRHVNKFFTTFDKDNDDSPNDNCAIIRRGAWWYQNCADVNLNGNWGRGKPDGAFWDNITVWESVSFSEIKIREID